MSGLLSHGRPSCRWAIVLAVVAVGALVGVFVLRSDPGENTPAQPEDAAGPTADAPASSRPASQPLAWEFGYDEAGEISDVVKPAGHRTTLCYERDASQVVRKVAR